MPKTNILLGSKKYSMQFNGRLTDLDELLLRCRAPQSKAFLAEAIACYQAGAYRSAIISTWIAVVFDLISKFKELALTGDTEAQKAIDDLEQRHLENNIAESLNFERNVLERARKEFQFISPIEQEDLQRLLADRNRCAHPSLRSLEEPYQPSGELVRSHIYNAVTILLQHPPKQGRKALQSILDTIESDAFPTQVDRALEQYFKHSPLVNARPTLIKDVIAVLTKHLLLDPLSEAERLRKFTALLAVLELCHQEGERIFREELPKIAQRVFTHAQLANLLIYLQIIPSAWYALGDSGRDKARYFLESGPKDQIVALVPVALDIPALYETAYQRLATFSDEELSQLLQQDSHFDDYFLEGLKRWSKSSLYEESKRLTKLFLVPFLSKDLTAEQTAQIIQACSENSQLYNNYFPTIHLFKTQLFPLSEDYLEQTKEAWLLFYKQFYIFLPPDKLVRRSGLIDDQEWLLNSIEQRYPEIFSIATKQAQEEYIPDTWNL